MAGEISFKGHKSCQNHFNEEVKFMCENCTEKACDSCVSTTHRGHNLIAIKDIAQEKYNKLQDLNNDIWTTVLPRIKIRYKTAQISVKKITDGIRLNIKSVKGHGQHLKELIEKSTTETVSELEDLEKETTKQLDRFKEDTETVTRRLEDLMKENNEAMASDNNLLVVDTEEYSSSLIIDEPEFELKSSTTVFVKGLCSEPNIKAAFGSLRRIVEPVSSPILSLPFVPCSMQTTNQGTLWVNEFMSRELTSIDTNGSRKKLKLELDFGVLDICVDKLTDQLYCALEDFSIRAIDTNTGKTTLLFATEIRPYCLNCTRSGNTFIVGSFSEPEVKLYTREGVLLQTVITLMVPQRIAVCGTTGQVAIACGALMVWRLNDDRLHHVLNYKARGNGKGFKDIGIGHVAFDDNGFLFAADYSNRAVHIIDAANCHLGMIFSVDKAIRCLTTRKSGVFVICTDTSRKILAVTINSSQVLSISYLNNI